MTWDSEKLENIWVKLTRYWESNWQVWHSILRVKLTRYWESIWLNNQSQIDKFETRYWESNWLDIESQINSIMRAKLSIWLSISSQFDSNILQLFGIPGKILVPPVTQHFRSKWLHFFQWGKTAHSLLWIFRVKATRILPKFEEMY